MPGDVDVTRNCKIYQNSKFLRIPKIFQKNIFANFILSRTLIKLSHELNREFHWRKAKLIKTTRSSSLLFPWYQRAVRGKFGREKSHLTLSPTKS